MFLPKRRRKSVGMPSLLLGNPNSVPFLQWLAMKLIEFNAIQHIIFMGFRLFYKERVLYKDII